MPRPHRHSTLTVGVAEVAVTRKQMKNLLLRVSPAGQVLVSAPFSTRDAEIRRFVESRSQWIEQQQGDVASKSLETPAEYVDDELHWVWGTQLPLKVSIGPRAVNHTSELLEIVSRSGSTPTSRERQVSTWYREQLKERIPQLLEKWEPRLGVSLAEWRIRKMKTRWGSCNVKDRRVWLSLSLAKYRPELLEYVVVHELVHLEERLHGDRFKKLMSDALPGWSELKAELNRLPMR